MRLEVLKLHKCDTNRGSRKGGEPATRKVRKDIYPRLQRHGVRRVRGRERAERDEEGADNPNPRLQVWLNRRNPRKGSGQPFFRTRSVCCPSAPTAFKPSTLRDCNYACLLGLGLCTSRLQFSRFLEYGCTVLYNGVLSMRTRLLKPCAAQICCSDGVLKNVLCMSECLGGSSDCI